MSVFTSNAQTVLDGGNPGRVGFGVADTSKVKKRTGKILDDSTKNVYGAYTTQYFTEKDWFYETGKLSNVDTIPTNFHRYNFVQRNDWGYQDLGNLATAGRSIFFSAPTQIGARLGITAFDYLLLQPSDIVYYNTKSPYSKWQLVLGGGGRSLLTAGISQNVNPRVNAGVQYRRITNRLLIGTRKQNNENRHADFQNILLHTNVTSADGRYRILAHLNIANQSLLETGGLNFSDTTENLRSLFDLEQGQLSNKLTDADGEYYKGHFHVYQEFKLIDSTKFKLFHEYNQIHLRTVLSDASIDSVSGVYEDFFLRGSDEATFHKTRYNESDHKLGVKWRKNRLFMGSYFRFKTFGFTHFPGDDEQFSEKIESQSFVGAVGNYTINDSTRLDFEAEYMLFKDYRVSGTLKTKVFEVNFQRTFFEPSLLDQFYFGNHFRWRNTDFLNTITDELSGSIPIRLKNHVIQPFAKLQRIENLVYLNTEATPEQFKSAISLVQVGVKNQGQLGKYWHYNTKALFTQNDGDDKLPMPNLTLQGQIYFQKSLFGGAFPAQIGLDAYWNDAYFAPNYQPVLQRFYVQNRYEIGNYPVVDLFMNGNIKAANIFLKVTNILNPILGEGYFATPGYMAQPTQFEFGFRWLFYD